MGLSRHAQSLQYALNVLRTPKYKPYIRSVYLYGSCARLQQTFDSDVDLFLFLDREMPDHLIREMRLDVIPHYSLPEVEIKYSKNDEFSSSYQFNQNLERDARLIWERQK
ncbi:MAG: nucleotidyltransferase domain-containing protein [Eubacterium sp.]|nr:nucleotidyltransferase domain-containing protein [Eubacterium sp.]